MLSSGRSYWRLKLRFADLPMKTNRDLAGRTAEAIRTVSRSSSSAALWAGQVLRFRWRRICAGLSSWVQAPMPQSVRERVPRLPEKQAQRLPVLGELLQAPRARLATGHADSSLW